MTTVKPQEQDAAEIKASQSFMLFGAVLLDIAIWTFTSAAEDNTAIIAIHLLFLGFFGLVLNWIRSITAIKIFMVALLLRSTAMLFAWFTAYNASRHFAIGTNPDAINYWRISHWSFQHVIKAYEDVLFPLVNMWLTNFSITVGDASYLATAQTILFAGTWFAPICYLFVRDIYGEKVGRVAGYLLVFSPAAIVFSTGLMRDALIGAVGFTFLSCINRILISKTFGHRLIFIILGLMMAGMLGTLRTVSLALFVLAAAIIVIFNTPANTNQIPLRIRAWIVACVAAVGCIGVAIRFERIVNIMAYTTISKLGIGAGSTLDQNGFTAQILHTSPALFVFISPVALIQPIPFYNWLPPWYMPGPVAAMDVLLGLGGLYHQTVFGFYLIAVYYWILKRDKFGLALGAIYTLLTCTGILIGMGQIRETMCQTYPLFYMAIAVAIVRVCNENPKQIGSLIVGWILTMGALYCAYMLIRIPEAIVATIIFIFLALWGTIKMAIVVQSAVAKHRD